MSTSSHTPPLNNCCLLVAACAWLALGLPGLAQQDLSRELAGGRLFPPDFVYRNADQLALTQQQRDSLQQITREAQGKLEESQRTLSAANQKLAQCVNAPHIDEAQTLAALDEVLRGERAIKQTRLIALARVKNQLTPEQQDKLRQLVKTAPDGKDRPSPGQADREEEMRLRQELSARMQKVRAAIERRRSEGHDPQPVLETMKRFGELMQNGNLREAREVLDKAVEQLKADPQP